MPKNQTPENKTEYISGALSFRLKPQTLWWLITAVIGALGAYFGIGR